MIIDNTDNNVWNNDYVRISIDVTINLDTLSFSKWRSNSMLTLDLASSFNGKYYQIHNAYCNPKPVQKPSPPIIAGSFDLLGTVNDWDSPW